MEGGHVMITHRTSSHAVKGDFVEGKKERRKGHKTRMSAGWTFGQVANVQQEFT